MYSRLVVNNYRVFEHLDVELSPITLISGRNNTGKTALLEALLLHSSGPAAGNSAMRIAEMRTGQPSVLMAASAVGAPWESSFLDLHTETPIKFTGEIDGISSSVVLIGVGSGESAPTGLEQRPGTTSSRTHANALRIIVRRRPDGNDEEYSFTPVTTVQVTGTSRYLQLGPAAYQLTPEASEPLVSTYFVGGRSRASQFDLAARYSELKIQGYGDDFLVAMKVVEPRLKSIEILVLSNQPTLYMNTGTSPMLPLTAYGEAMSIVADIISIIYLNRGGLLLVDELENGVHFSALAQLWTHIRLAAETTGTQVVATTHSRECLEAAHRALSSEPDLMRLLRLWRDPSATGSVVATSYDAKTLESALDLDLDVR